jgi:hypothetical protein
MLMYRIYKISLKLQPAGAGDSCPLNLSDASPNVGHSGTDVVV